MIKRRESPKLYIYLHTSKKNAAVAKLVDAQR